MRSADGQTELVRKSWSRRILSQSRSPANRGTGRIADFSQGRAAGENAAAVKSLPHVRQGPLRHARGRTSDPDQRRGGDIASDARNGGSRLGARQSGGGPRSIFGRSLLDRKTRRGNRGQDSSRPELGGFELGICSNRPQKQTLERDAGRA